MQFLKVGTMWYQEVGTSCYKSVSIGINWYQLLLNGTKVTTLGIEQ